MEPLFQIARFWGCCKSEELSENTRIEIGRDGLSNLGLMLIKAKKSAKIKTNISEIFASSTSQQLSYTREIEWKP